MPHIDALLHTIQATPYGASLATLLAQHPNMARRTLQRKLATLRSQGLITAQGKARAVRYFSVTGLIPHAQLEEPTPTADQFPTFIPVQADSNDILVYLSRPPPARKPVGYQQDFLDAYLPNQVHYLPAALRQHLHHIGKTHALGQAAGTYSRAILSRLLIDLSWASSHLEGNTYSRLDTVKLIEQGQAAQGKAAMETQMILNHKTAIELLVANVDEAQINRYTLTNLHAALAENLLPNPLDEGRVRQHAVDIGQSVYRPLSTPQQIDAALDKLLLKAQHITDPFEQSFFMMVHLPYLQPFADINKRTSRLMANLPLFKANLCPLTFLDVPEAAYSRAMLGVYEMTRVELLRDLYAWAYERSTQEYLAIKQVLAEPDPLRLAWRHLIKDTIRDTVQHPQPHAQQRIATAIQAQVPATDQAAVLELVLQELHRLHEGILARYGLKPSEFDHWKQSQKT